MANAHLLSILVPELKVTAFIGRSVVVAPLTLGSARKHRLPTTAFTNIGPWISSEIYNGILAQ